MKSDTKYEIGDYFLCLEHDLKGYATYGFVGKITQIKKRLIGNHRYHYKVIARWGKNFFLDDSGVLIPGMLNYEYSMKLSQKELDFIRILVG